MTLEEKAAHIIHDIKNEQGIAPAVIFRNMAAKEYISIHGPEHHVLDESWGEHMAYTSEALAALGETGGPRCCKRDAMLAFEVAVKYINAHYDVSLEYERQTCGFSERNVQCIKEKCPFSIPLHIA